MPKGLLDPVPVVRGGEKGLRRLRSENGNEGPRPRSGVLKQHHFAGRR
jgi:hypothetical protein